jgi:hypothetical protein
MFSIEESYIFDLRFVSQILKTVRSSSALQQITYSHHRIQAVFLHLVFDPRMRDGEKYCGTVVAAVYMRRMEG